MYKYNIFLVLKSFKTSKRGYCTQNKYYIVLAHKLTTSILNLQFCLCDRSMCYFFNFFLYLIWHVKLGLCSSSSFYSSSSIPLFSFSSSIIGFNCFRLHLPFQASILNLFHSHLLSSIGFNHLRN